MFISQLWDRKAALAKGSLVKQRNLYCWSVLPNAQQSENVVILRSFESEDEEVEQSVAEKH